jgi:hypothetical protein
VASKPTTSSIVGISLRGTWLLRRRCPALRWRDSDLGSSVELREPVVPMLTEKPKWKNHEGVSTDAGHWGGPACSSDEATVMVVEQRGWIRQLNLMLNWERTRRRYWK